MGPAKPNLLVRYRTSEGDHGLDGHDGTAYALIYVRPETNRLFYEGEILSAVRHRAEVVYMANLNGSIFLEHDILRAHYASQFRFANDPRAALAEYPEVAAAFESHFGLPASEADIVGSFTAVEELGLSSEELFSDIVPGTDFLSCFGQTFKRLGGRYIVNYDLPAIKGRCSSEANVFAVLVRCEAAEEDFYLDLNRAIYEEMISRPETPIMIDEKLAGLAWPERVRRTYHVSVNRIMAMLDMADFVFIDESNRLDVAATPLGAAIVAAGALDAAGLRTLKDRHLCRIGPPGRSPEALVYLPQPGASLGRDGATGLLRRCSAYIS